MAKTSGTNVGNKDVRLRYELATTGVKSGGKPAKFKAGGSVDKTEYVKYGSGYRKKPGC